MEKGTCFSLWRDVIDNLSRYEAADDMFHVMHVSTDHLSRVGLSFDCAEAARAFADRVRALTADPANIRLSAPGSSMSATEREDLAGLKRARKRYKRPDKREISLPCGFQHVVSVDQKDSDKYFSLQAYVENMRISGGGARAGAPKKGLAPQPPGPGPQVKPHGQRAGGLAASQRWGSSPTVAQEPQLSLFQSCNELRC